MHHCNAYRMKFYWELSSHILPYMLFLLFLKSLQDCRERGTVSQPLSVFLSRAAIFFSCYKFDRDWWWVFWLVVNTASASDSVHLVLTGSEAKRESEEKETLPILLTLILLSLRFRYLSLDWKVTCTLYTSDSDSFSDSLGCVNQL